MSWLAGADGPDGALSAAAARRGGRTVRAAAVGVWGCPRGAPAIRSRVPASRVFLLRWPVRRVSSLKPAQPAP
eukprot:1960026-Lingulodinium_polyedra.AAC.1